MNCFRILKNNCPLYHGYALLSLCEGAPIISNNTTNILGTGYDFDKAGPAAGYVLLGVWLIVGYWFLHAGWEKFAFVAGFLMVMSSSGTPTGLTATSTVT